MTIQKFFATGLCAGVLAALPAVGLAMAPRQCVTGPAALSNTGNFQNEADTLLQDLQNRASQVQQHAATLRSFARSDEVTWQAHANQLRQVKAEINDMGQKLCRLTSMRRDLAPWQRQAVNRIAPNIRLAADNAEDAINYLNAHQQSLWEPAYRTYVRNLDREATQVSTTVNHFQQYARARHEYRVVAKDLGMRAAG